MHAKSRKRRSSDLSNGVPTISSELKREDRALMLSIAEDNIDTIPSGEACIPHILRHFNQLTTLNLFDKQIKSKGLSKIERAICESTSLKEIMLRYNNISHISSDCIKRILLANNGILKIDLEDNELKDDGLSKIAEALHHTTVPCIYLKHNTTTFDGRSSDHLMQAVLANTSIISISYYNISEDILILLKARATTIKCIADEFIAEYKSGKLYTDTLLRRLIFFKNPVNYMIWEQELGLARLNMVLEVDKITSYTWISKWLKLCGICNSHDTQESALLINKEVLSCIASLISPKDIKPHSLS